MLAKEPYWQKTIRLAKRLMSPQIVTSEIPRVVRLWLMAGIVLIFVQVNIGGITRLTDSGLSITEWEVIEGTLPPLGEDAWVEAFDKYKLHAEKQYEEIHGGEDMTMSEFKVIYFWEWFHRFWARSIGFVFLFPFIFFLIKGWLPTWLIKRLGIVVAFAALAAVFGIIMVYSGFNDDTRTWVSAYKLLGHLSIACLTFGYLFWTWLKVKYPSETYPINNKIESPLPALKPLLKTILVVLLIQIGFGALMAGMRAGLVHPYLTVFNNGDQFWSMLMSRDGGSLVDTIVDYEKSQSIKAWVQLFHRITAYILTALILLFMYKIKGKIRFPHSYQHVHKGAVFMTVMLLVQVLLGILTIVNSVGKIPVIYGVLHQAGALLLLAFVLFSTYHINRETTS